MDTFKMLICGNMGLFIDDVDRLLIAHIHNDYAVGLAVPNATTDAEMVFGNFK